MRVKHHLLALAAAFGLMSAPADSALIDLGFSLDGSGSISTSDFELTRDALAIALGSIPTTGPNQYRVAVTTFSFAVRTVVAPTIVTAANISSIQATVRTAFNDRSTTATDRAIRETFGLFAAVGLGDTTLLNITTDGLPNSQSDAESAANFVFNQGLDGLSFEAVGSGLTDAIAQANLARIAGFGTAGNPLNGVIVTDLTMIPNATTTGFVLPTSDFAAYQGAISAKIGQVVVDTGGGGGVPPIPVPAGLPLLATGFAVLAFLRRKRAAA